MPPRQTRSLVARRCSGLPQRGQRRLSGRAVFDLPQSLSGALAPRYMNPTLPMRTRNLADREGLARSRRHHELMIELLKGRDSWALAQLCVDHMQFSKSDYLARIAGETES